MAKVLIGNFKGPKGDKGVKGDPGTAATIQVGTTQTVQPEENAEVTNIGTTTAAVLNFKIPRGEDGMTDLTAEYKDASEYTCQPTVNAPVVVKGLDGKTEQVETTGAQLIEYPYLMDSQTINGVTFSVLNQGEIRVQGEATQTVNFALYLLNYKNGESYYISGCPKGGSSGTYNIRTGNGMAIDTGDGITYSPNEDGSTNININIQTGTKVNGLIFKPMLNSGSTALPWEPYTGGSPAPSPDYPQVIKGVGGMGYFDGEWVQGNISSTGTVGTETTGITSANAIPCKQSDSIVVTYEDSVDAIAVAFYNASGVYISTSTSSNNVDTFTATAPANAASFKINLRVASGGTITPSTAKYCTVTINGEYQTGVETTGAQLIEYPYLMDSQTINGVTFSVLNQGEIRVQGEATQTVNFALYLLNYKNGESYYISGCPKGGSSGTYNIRTGNGRAIDTGDGITYSPNEDGSTNININIQTGTKVNGLIFKPMLNSGSTALPWEPYHHTTLTIPLTAPLYEGDKICYVKPGESYVNADGDTVTADGVLYGVYRENAVVTFDGSEDEGWILNTETNDFGQYTIIGASGILSADGTLNASTGGVSSNFGVSNQIGAGNEKSGAWIYNSTTVALVLPKDLVEYNVSALKTWLSTNQLTVVYRLAQPYFEPFSDQSIFYDLRTDDTLSYVYSSDPIAPNVTVEVAKNSTGGYLLESYAQAQKNAISEANSQSRLSAIEQQLVNQATTPTE